MSWPAYSQYIPILTKHRINTINVLMNILLIQSISNNITMLTVSSNSSRYLFILWDNGSIMFGLNYVFWWWDSSDLSSVHTWVMWYGGHVLPRQHAIPTQSKAIEGITFEAGIDAGVDSQLPLRLYFKFSEWIYFLNFFYVWM